MWDTYKNNNKMASLATVKCCASPWVALAPHLICSRRIPYIPAAVPPLKESNLDMTQKNQLKSAGAGTTVPHTNLSCYRNGGLHCWSTLRTPRYELFIHFQPFHNSFNMSIHHSSLTFDRLKVSDICFTIVAFPVSRTVLN